MDNPSVNKSVNEINPKTINKALLKADALLQMALKSELQALPIYVLHDYFWILSDLISQLKALMESQ